jgi:NAD(P)-dependent dehydrogenase (short-subunit alcohol dehydrogenase family)
MPDTLFGKTALITGGGHRIGRAIALSLAQEKVNCVIQSLPEHGESAAEVVREIKTAGVEAHVVRADFSKPGGAEKIFPALRKRDIRIDYLINNASIFEKSGIFEIGIKQLAATLTVNAFGPLILARGFVRQTRVGAIVNILDTRVSGYDTEHAGYSLSKTMLLHLTEMMALECAPGIRVNAVAPGLILPPKGKTNSYLKEKRHRNLLDRHGCTKNVTDSVIFLLKNDFITGETLFVDGGERLKKNWYDG